MPWSSNQQPWFLDQICIQGHRGSERGWGHPWLCCPLRIHQPSRFFISHQRCQVCGPRSRRRNGTSHPRSWAWAQGQLLNLLNFHNRSQLGWWWQSRLCSRQRRQCLQRFHGQIEMAEHRFAFCRTATSSCHSWSLTSRRFSSKYLWVPDRSLCSWSSRVSSVRQPDAPSRSLPPHYLSNLNS